MNILFVNYGDFTTNSLNHIAGFANTLCAAGHACAVAVPSAKETLKHIPHPLFIAVTHEEALARPGLFPDGRPAEVIHAWTPREAVRTFVLAYQRRAGGTARVIIHLEDNERFLAESYTGRTSAELGELGARELAAILPAGLSHPVRHDTFLRTADGITHIIDRLREFAPEGTPVHRLFPGIDFSAYHPQAPSADLRRELGVGDHETVIVFTGSNTFANEPEMRELYLAVALLNQRGRPTRLVRTGFNSPHFQDSLSEDVRRHVIDLGFVEKGRLPGLLALADLLVQPGQAGPFNDYRLPSKLPEFLAMGKPVLLPATNLALLLEDGRDARFLRSGTPEEIADRCEELLADGPRRAALGEHAAAFARGHFDLARNTQALATFYQAVRERPPVADWSLVVDPATSDATLMATAFADRLARTATGGDGAAVAFARESALVARTMHQVERSVATAVQAAEAERDATLQREQLTRQHAANLEQLLTSEKARAEASVAAEQAESANRERLTRQHAANLEELLAAARAHAAALDEARNLTQAHADNLERELVRHRDRREQADALLHSARRQTTAYENALLEADAQIAALRGELEVLRGDPPALRHIANLEGLLAASHENAARLELARKLTQDHADNLQRELGIQKARRDQADVLLRSARQQVTAYENAMLEADAELIRLRDELVHQGNRLQQARDEIALTHNHARNLEALRAQAVADGEARLAFAVAAQAAQLAEAAARLAAAEELVRARDAKIRRMTRSFSWQATAPLRALRRFLLDRGPALPAASPALIGNIDYPQEWANIPPTLNVRGWTLHRERVSLRAIRASLDGRSVPAEWGLERLDVLDHFRDYPGAERSGWIVKVEVPRFGQHRLVIEAEDEKGARHVVHARVIRRTAEAAPPPPNSYSAWVAAYDTLTPQDADRIRARLKKLKRRPLISVLMPTYNTPEKWLVKAIESVRQQLYDNWELCIADDASKQPHVRQVLERYRKKDPRIKVVIRETNGHISAASNSALALAHGEFIALLDHDDELRPHALACVALELDAHPDADLVYSDEDKIDENGHRYDHYFKPDWNPDLFLVQNYISHLGVYRTLLVREVGGFRVGYEGSQDWDLAMRVTERTEAARIRHIPKILYHWRSVPGSTAMLIGAKSYAMVAAEKVINEHLQRTGSAATISPTKGSYWRIHHPVPTPAPKVTLIIPTRNRLNVLRPCVESLLAKTTYPNFEILIIDNDSDDPDTLAWLEAVQAPSAGRAPVRVSRFAGEFNFSAINNHGVRQTDAPVVGLLNNDLEAIDGDWLNEMVSHALRPEIGCVGAKLYYPDDRIQHAGVILGIGGVAAHAWQTHPRGAAGQAHRNLLQQNLSAVTAACLLIRREVYLEVGGLDEKLKVAFNDVDFCLAVRAAGYRNLWTPYAELYHHESASRGAEDTLEKRDRFRGEVEYITAKWGDALLNDPAYNPNLTLTINDFTLSTPPRPWPRLEG